MRLIILIIGIFYSGVLHTQDINYDGFFIKADYGVQFPLGNFGQFEETNDSYALTGHGGSISVGLHLNDKWSLALAVHNSYNKIDQVPLFSFNSKEHYQFIQVNVEPYLRFATYPTVFYIKPIAGVISRVTPWFTLVQGPSFLEQWIVVNPKPKLGINYGLGAGALFKSKKNTQWLIEIQANNTRGNFEVYQGDLLSGVRFDLKKSFLFLTLKLGFLISN